MESNGRPPFGNLKTFSVGDKTKVLWCAACIKDD